MRKILTFFLFCAVLYLYADTHEEIFDRTTKYLDRGGLTFQYQNLENLNNQVASLLDIFGRNYVNDPIGQKIFKNFQILTESMRFDELQSWGVSTKRLQSNLYANKLFTAVKPQSAGLLCALMGKNNVRFRIGADLPAETIFAAGVYLDWNKFSDILEKSFSDKNEFNNFSVMFEQIAGIRIHDLMRNCTGEFFAGIFRGTKNREFHFAVILPDNQNKLKLLAKRYFGPSLMQNKDGSAIFEMPVAASDFGSGVTVVFAHNQVYIYNSNAPIADLLKCGVNSKKLVDVSPEIFGMLKKIDGNSYAVVNLDIKDIDRNSDSYVYRIGSVCKYTGEGYFVSGISDFNLQDISEYAVFLKLLPFSADTGSCGSEK